ncbi:hypothetical protein, partial [Alistipes finegoldii]|uniref:hypothetical protein n=1 Tax=Alistipes finegoldii TaxID=214856 RepID=UPI003AB74929
LRSEKIAENEFLPQNPHQIRIRIVSGLRAEPLWAASGAHSDAFMTVFGPHTEPHRLWRDSF